MVRSLCRIIELNGILEELSDSAEGKHLDVAIKA